MNTMFENAKVGDRVWDFIYGWGTITSIDVNSDFPIAVSFDNMGYLYTYSFGGTLTGLNVRRLFWDEIKYEIPTQPKRKVKKQFTHWRLAELDGTLSDENFETKELALDYAKELGFIWMIYPVEIKYEIEVEE